MNKKRCAGLMGLVISLCMVFMNVSGVSAKEILLRYASGYVPWAFKHAPQEVKGPEVFCEIINKKGAGKVKVEFFPSGQLFKDKDMTTAVPKGSADMGITVNSQWLSLVPSCALFSLPLIFDDEEHFWRTFEGKAGEILAREFEKRNLKLLGMLNNGPIVILTKSKPVDKPNLKGFKLRVYGKIPAIFAEATGGSPMFMSASEIFLALQRGTVDGLFTSTYGMAGYKLYEVTKYTIGIPNWFASFVIVINLDKWKSLPEDVKGIIADAATETMTRARKEKWTEKHAKESFEIAIKNGMVRHIVTPEEYKEWKRSSKAVEAGYLEIAGEVGEKLLECAREARNK